MEKNLIAFSGGGIRAAVFALGALKGIKQEGKSDIFSHASAVSGGGLTLAPFVSWYRTKKDRKEDPMSDDNFKEFEDDLRMRMLKKGLWTDIILNWRFLFWGAVSLLIWTFIYWGIGVLLGKYPDTTCMNLFLDTLSWQFLYLFTILSIIALCMRTWFWLYWIMAGTGIGLILAFYFLEPIFFNVEPWFLKGFLIVLGSLLMMLFRGLIALFILGTGLVFIPLQKNKQIALKRIFRRIYEDIFKIKIKIKDKVRYSNPDEKYKKFRPIMSAVNMIEKRLVIFQDNEIHQIGKAKYKWKNNTDLNDIATVANFTCNFPCLFRPDKVEFGLDSKEREHIKKKDKENMANLLDGGILDNLGLWGPLFSSNIHDPFKKVLSIDAGNPKKKFKSRLWFKILLKMISSGVSRIESITVQVAALRNNLKWPGNNIKGLSFGHVDMSDDCIDQIINGLYEAWKRGDIYYNKGDIRDGLSWLDDSHIYKLFKKLKKYENDSEEVLINKVRKLDKNNFIEEVKDAARFKELVKFYYLDKKNKKELKEGEFDEETFKESKLDEGKFYKSFKKDVKRVAKIKVNLGPVSDKSINAGMRLAQIFTRLVIRIYLLV